MHDDKVKYVYQAGMIHGCNKTETEWKKQVVDRNAMEAIFHLPCMVNGHIFQCSSPKLNN